MGLTWWIYCWSKDIKPVNGESCHTPPWWFIKRYLKVKGFGEFLKEGSPPSTAVSKIDGEWFPYIKMYWSLRPKFASLLLQPSEDVTCYVPYHPSMVYWSTGETLLRLNQDEHRNMYRKKSPFSTSELPKDANFTTLGPHKKREVGWFKLQSMFVSCKPAPPPPPYIYI